MLKGSEDYIVSYIKGAGDSLDVPEYVNGKLYDAGELCKYVGLIYRAKVPNQVMPTNLVFWQCMGDAMELPQIYTPEPVIVKEVVHVPVPTPVIQEVIVEKTIEKIVEKTVRPPLTAFWDD